jgi:hypothetical protein
MSALVHARFLVPVFYALPLSRFRPCRRAFAWLADAMEQVFLGDLFPGIIGFGRFTASAIPLR